MDGVFRKIAVGKFESYLEMGLHLRGVKVLNNSDAMKRSRNIVYGRPLAKK